MEAAYTLENDDIDHGNFLEILLLLRKYDSVLQNHINMRRFTSTAPARGARVPNPAISNSCL